MNTPNRMLVCAALLCSVSAACVGSELDVAADGGADGALEDDLELAALEAALVPNQTPSVTLTAPSSGATFVRGASITLAANAGDTDGVVSKVEFFAGTTKLGEDLSSPYSFTWSNVALGDYRLTARATDNLGASATSSSVPISVISPSTPPTVSIMSPSEGANIPERPGVTINAQATDTDGVVTKVDFLDNGRLVGTDLTSPYTFTYVAAPGDHTLTAVATDNASLTATSRAVHVRVVASPCTNLPQYVENGGYGPGSTVKNGTSQKIGDL